MYCLLTFQILSFFFNFYVRMAIVWQPFYLYILFQNCVTDQKIWFKHYAMRDVGMRRQVVGTSTIGLNLQEAVTISHQTRSISFLHPGDNCCKFLCLSFCSDKTLFPLLTTSLTSQHRQCNVTSEPKAEIQSFFLHQLKWVFLEPGRHICRSLIQYSRPCGEELGYQEGEQPTVDQGTGLCRKAQHSQDQRCVLPQLTHAEPCG